MFVFVVLEDESGQALGFEARGHVGARKKGENLACAAASLLTQTLIAGIKDEVQLPIELGQGRGGEISCRFARVPLPAQQEKIDFLLRVMERGFRSLGKMDEGADIRIERKRDPKAGQIEVG